MILCSKEDLHKPVIYKLTCLKNGKIYVGQARDFYKRMLAHKWYIENPRDYAIWWVKLFYERDHARSFETDYQAEILEIVEDDRERNIRERYWIKTLDSTNPSIGFNTRPGGEEHVGHKSFMKNAYTRKRGKNCTKFSMYFVYDILQKNLVLIMSMKGVLQYIGMQAVSNLSYFELAKNRYAIFPFSENRRRKIIREYVSDREHIAEKHAAKHEDDLVRRVYSKMIPKLKLYCKIEKSISMHYGKIEHAISGRVIAELNYWKDYIHKIYLRYYDSDSSVNDFSSYTDNNEEELCVVYNVKAKTFERITKISDVAAEYDCSEKTALKRIQCAIPIKHRYYIYPIDLDILDLFMTRTRANIGKRGKAHMYQYMEGYFATRKFLMNGDLIYE